MVFFKSIHLATVLTAALPKTLNVNESTSIKGVAQTLAAGTMSYYPGTVEAFADLPQPYYWWECGALMGAMLDYSHYVGDNQYDRKIATALLAQVAPTFDFMTPAHYGDLGNDDQAFWGFAVMAAAERNFPQPDEAVPSWLDMGANIFNSLAGRWNTSSCGGGLMWQIFPSNPNGMHYKNSVSNGGLFQLAARLARATGNTTYAEWAEKVWDWTTGVGMIDSSFNVLDGADIAGNCSDMSGLSFSYSHGIYMYGAAVMANHTGDKKWLERTTNLVESSRSFFGGPENNVTNVMYEHACEQVETCNTDMKSFKGYLARFMHQSRLMVPSLAPAIDALMSASAAAAAQTCTGGDNGTTCGQKWYVGGFDGSVGLGQQMSALETIQGLLAVDSTPPFQGNQIRVVRNFSSAAPTSTAASPSATADTMPTKRDSGAVAVGANMRLLALPTLLAVLLWALA